jgi:hypothetical protein
MTEVVRRRKRRASAVGSRHVVDAIFKALEPRPITAGDRVRWNGRYTGRVLAINGDDALVEEPNNKAFGRPVEWQLLLAALTRCGP